MRALPLLAAAAALCLTGCAAPSVEMYASAVEEPHPGRPAPAKSAIVRYSTLGPKVTVSRNRDEAEAMMEDYCTGPHRVAVEGHFRGMDLGSSILPIGRGGVTSEQEDADYWMIAFRCEQRVVPVLSDAQNQAQSVETSSAAIAYTQLEREDAERAMDGYCLGGWNIISEGRYRLLDADFSSAPGPGPHPAEDDRRWVILFECSVSSTEAAPPSAEAGPRPQIPLDAEALRKLPIDEGYRRLARADKAEAARFLASYKTYQDKLTDYILKNKGQASGFSWRFDPVRGLSPEETRFLNWYLLNYTDYKPAP